MIEIIGEDFFMSIMIIMFQPGHKIAHITTAELSWHVHIFVLILLFFLE